MVINFPELLMPLPQNFNHSIIHDFRHSPGIAAAGVHKLNNDSVYVLVIARYTLVSRQQVCMLIVMAIQVYYDP